MLMRGLTARFTTLSTAALCGLLLTVPAAAQAAVPTSGQVNCTYSVCIVSADAPGTNATPASAKSGSAKAGKPKGSDGKEVNDDTGLLTDSDCGIVAPTQTTCLIGNIGGLTLPGAPANPAAPAAPTITAAQVARMAVSRLAPDVPTVHASPGTDEETGRVGTETFGLVGMPIWLWSNGPLAGSTVTVTAGPFTVTAVAKLDHVRYDMGDGHVANCWPMSDGRVGTPYPGTGIEPSPTCGYEGYQKTSRKQPGMKYTITSTATWDVSWTGADTGATTLTTQDVGHFPIGEAQALITSYGASA